MRRTLLGLLFALAWDASARAVCAERFVISLDPQVGCPSRAELAHAFGTLAAPDAAPGLRQIRIAPASPGVLRVTLRGPGGEVLAVHELAAGGSPCRALASTIALLATTWSEALPLAWIGEAEVSAAAPPVAPQSSAAQGEQRGSTSASATVTPAAVASPVASQSPAAQSEQRPTASATVTPAAVAPPVAPQSPAAQSEQRPTNSATVTPAAVASPVAPQSSAAQSEQRPTNSATVTPAAVATPVAPQSSAAQSEQRGSASASATVTPAAVASPVAPQSSAAQSEQRPTNSATVTPAAVAPPVAPHSSAAQGEQRPTNSATVTPAAVAPPVAPHSSAAQGEQRGSASASATVTPAAVAPPVAPQSSAAQSEQPGSARPVERPTNSPAFRPGPLSVRASGIGVLDVAPADLGGGGQLAVDLGLGKHFSVGLSAALLSNETASDPSYAGGSLLLHRQRYTIFGGYGFAPRSNQWGSLQLGLEDQHFIAQTFGYRDPLHGSFDDPALSLQALYAHVLLGPLFAFAQGGVDILLTQQYIFVAEANGQQQTLLTVAPVSFDLQVGLGLRLF